MWQTVGALPIAQGPHAADAQHHLLADSHVVVAPVQPSRDLPILGAVLRDVGIEQIQGHTSDLDAPEAGQHLVPRQGDTHQQRGTVRARFGNQRQVVKIVFRIAFLLPAVHVQVLTEVAFAVHQADAHQRQTQVAGRLQVVPGQEAQAAGVDRDAIVDAKLRREIGDAALARGRAVGFLIPGRTVQVGLEGFFHPIHVGQETVVVLQLFHARLVHRPEQFHRAVLHGIEQVRVDTPEQGYGIMVPTPPQVVSQALQGLKTLRQIGKHRESTDGTRSHESYLSGMDREKPADCQLSGTSEKEALECNSYAFLRRNIKHTPRVA